MQIFRILILFLAIPIFSFSQPIIQADWAPKPGDIWHQQAINELFEPTNSGANQIWDFSSATPLAFSKLAFNFVPVAEGNNSECYPDATVAADLLLEGTGSGFAYGYYGLDEEGFKFYGQSSAGSKTILEDPQQFSFIGLEYEQIETDEYSGSLESDFFNTKIGGNTSYFYDAYGTVILPQQTFADVVRIYQVDVQHDTLTVGGLVEVTKDSIVSYAYMAPGSIFPIALWQYTSSYSEAFLNGVSQGSEFNESDQTFTINDEFITTSVENPILLSNWKIYPTFATDRIMLENQNVVEEQIFIYDTNGKLVGSTVINSTKYSQDIMNLPSAQYFISNSKKQVIGKFQKI